MLIGAKARPLHQKGNKRQALHIGTAQGVVRATQGAQRKYKDFCAKAGAITEDTVQVAEGKHILKMCYKTLLNSPQILVLSFEPILNLPDQAYELKTGRTFDYFPVLSYIKADFF